MKQGMIYEIRDAGNFQLQGMIQTGLKLSYIMVYKFEKPNHLIWKNYQILLLSKKVLQLEAGSMHMQILRNVKLLLWEISLVLFLVNIVFPT